MTLRTFVALPAALISTALAIAPATAASMSEIVQANYPQESLARGEQGTVHFAVDLDEDARIESCVVTRSSGYARLDAATCDLIVLHASFAPAATEDGKRVATTRTGRIAWNLPQPVLTRASLAPAPVEISAAELEKGRLICRRSQVAGSLIKSKAHCLTRSEWKVADSMNREDLEEWLKKSRNANHK